MKELSLTKFLTIFFISTCLLPLLGLAFIHVSFLHSVLNQNQSYERLIETEEFYLVLVYLVIVFACISLGLWFFRHRVISPIESIVENMGNVVGSKQNQFLICGKKNFREIKNFIEKYNDMLFALNESSRQRDDLISSIAHDLKTPLLAEQKSFELLSDYQLSEQERTKILNSLKNNNFKTLDLIKNLLEFYKFNQIDQPIKKENISLKDFFDKLSVRFYPLLIPKNLTLVLDVKNDVEWLLIEEAGFRRAIDNLVANAIEHSKNDSTLRIMVNQDDVHTCIDICDQGVGIAPELQEQIFKPKDHISKHGLGLLICKKIIEKHHGKIILVRSDSAGTTFRITIPRY